MFDEMSKAVKEKDRVRYKGYATVRTTLGNLNIELHGDRVSVKAFVMSGANTDVESAPRYHRHLRRCIIGSSWQKRASTMIPSSTD